MTPERTPIHISNCAKTFPDGTRALLPANLQVEAGEVLALLGPSGCGKTTLLRLIAGLEIADQGSRIVFSEQDVTALPAEKRGVGMVFQSYALFPQMSVEANIGYGLKIQGVPEAERRRAVGELIDLVRLNGLEKKRAPELSGGQRQRVALARAVAVRPRVLLLDEPLAALDAKLKESLRDELAELLRRLGITAIHVTHDQQEALSIADRLAVMHAGAIVQVGNGESLYRNPAHPFVAQFLGRVNRISRDAAARLHGVVRMGGWEVDCPNHLKSMHALLVRPEDIQVGAPAAQWARGRVLRRTFLGDRVQLQLETEGQSPLMAELHGSISFTVGELVGLRIAPSRFLAAEEVIT